MIIPDVKYSRRAICSELLPGRLTDTEKFREGVSRSRSARLSRS